MCITKQQGWSKVCGRTSMPLMVFMTWIFQPVGHLWPASTVLDGEITDSNADRVCKIEEVCTYITHLLSAVFNFLGFFVCLFGGFFSVFLQFSYHVNALQLVHPRFPCVSVD